jgi:hypothetical protein
VEVFPHDTRAKQRGQFAGCAACRVVPRALQDRGAFSGDGVLPYLANFYRRAIRRAVRVGVRYATHSRIVDVWSAIRNRAVVGVKPRLDSLTRDRSTAFPQQIVS